MADNNSKFPLFPVILLGIIITFGVIGTYIYLTSTSYSTFAYGYFPTHNVTINIGDRLPYPHEIGNYYVQTYNGYIGNNTVVITSNSMIFYYHIGGKLVILNNSGDYYYEFLQIDMPSGKLLIKIVSLDKEQEVLQ